MSTVRKMMRQQQRVSQPGAKSIQMFDPNKFAEKLLEQARAISRAEILRVEQDIAKMRKEYDIMKGNIITISELLKERNIYSDKNYGNMYQKVFQRIIGLTDDLGRMPGKTTILLYNF